MWQAIGYHIYNLISSVKPFYVVDTLTIFILKMNEPRHRHLREMFKVCDCRSWLGIITGEPFLVFSSSQQFLIFHPLVVRKCYCSCDHFYFKTRRYQGIVQPFSRKVSSHHKQSCDFFYLFHKKTKK